MGNRQGTSLRISLNTEKICPKVVGTREIPLKSLEEGLENYEKAKDAFSNKPTSYFVFSLSFRNQSDRMFNIIQMGNSPMFSIPPVFVFLVAYVSLSFAFLRDSYSSLQNVQKCVGIIKRNSQMVAKLKKPLV